MANKTITLAQVCEFINNNSKNAEVLREVRDLCKGYLKEEYETLRNQRKEERENKLQAWKDAQDALPMEMESFQASSGKQWLLITNSFKAKDAIKKAFPKAWYCSSRKGWAVPMEQSKEVKAFIKKFNAA